MRQSKLATKLSLAYKRRNLVGWRALFGEYVGDCSWVKVSEGPVPGTPCYIHVDSRKLRFKREFRVVRF